MHNQNSNNLTATTTKFIPEHVIPAYAGSNRPSTTMNDSSYHTLYTPSCPPPPPQGVVALSASRPSAPHDTMAYHTHTASSNAFPHNNDSSPTMPNGHSSFHVSNHAYSTTDRSSIPVDNGNPSLANYHHESIAPSHYYATYTHPSPSLTHGPITTPPINGEIMSPPTHQTHLPVYHYTTASQRVYPDYANQYHYQVAPAPPPQDFHAQQYPPPPLPSHLHAHSHHAHLPNSHPHVIHYSHNANSRITGLPASATAVAAITTNATANHDIAHRNDEMHRRRMAANTRPAYFTWTSNGHRWHSEKSHVFRACVNCRKGHVACDGKCYSHLVILAARVFFTISRSVVLRLAF
ncbi:hypothetical protein BDF19DRAFT_416494 [Syncephalis fuscata]|nr:hypothetical protein BDF19DRAFT_416494 [Syncephalis fuscata]